MRAYKGLERRELGKAGGGVDRLRPGRREVGAEDGIERFVHELEGLLAIARALHQCRPIDEADDDDETGARQDRNDQALANIFASGVIEIIDYAIATHWRNWGAIIPGRHRVLHQRVCRAMGECHGGHRPDPDLPELGNLLAGSRLTSTVRIGAIPDPPRPPRHELREIPS